MNLSALLHEKGKIIGYSYWLTQITNASYRLVDVTFQTQTGFVLDSP